MLYNKIKSKMVSGNTERMISTLKKAVPQVGKGTSIFSTTPIPNSVKIGRNCKISTGAVIGSNVSIGDNTVIGFKTKIYSNVKIGSNSIIEKNCLILPFSEIGDGCLIESNTLIQGSKIEPQTKVGANRIVYPHGVQTSQVF